MLGLGQAASAAGTLQRSPEGHATRTRAGMWDLSPTPSIHHFSHSLKLLSAWMSRDLGAHPQLPTPGLTLLTTDTGLRPCRACAKELRSCPCCSSPPWWAEGPAAPCRGALAKVTQQATSWLWPGLSHVHHAVGGVGADGIRDRLGSSLPDAVPLQAGSTDQLRAGSFGGTPALYWHPAASVPSHPIQELLLAPWSQKTLGLRRQPGEDMEKAPGQLDVPAHPCGGLESKVMEVWTGLGWMEP